MEFRDKKDCFTNEKLSKKFVSQFDLVNYAIRLAENMIKTGRDPRVNIGNQNRSMQILAEISQDKDFFDEVDEISVFDDNSNQNNHSQNNERSPNFSTHSKSSEKKRVRKIFED